MAFEHAKYIFAAACNAVQPQKLVKEALNFSDGILKVGNREFKVNKNVHLAAFGKASVGTVAIRKL